jgi:hypothetical protein
MPSRRQRVGQPVPGEDALDGDDEVVSVGRDGCEEVLLPAPQVLVENGLPLAVENAQIHGLGVEIDPAVVGVAFRVESHGSLLKRTVVSSSVQPTPSGVGAGGGLDEDQVVAADQAPARSKFHW